MTDLSPITALGGTVPESARFGALTITENADLALASLAPGRGAGAPAPMGLPLPGPGGWAQGGGIAALWTGPDQWLIEGAGRAAGDFADLIRGAAPGCLVTEQTDGFVAFEIASDAGAAAIEDLLAHLVNIDLSRFGPGCATRTGLEHMSVFVIRRTAERVAILGMRSAAGSLWHALTVAARRKGKTE